MIDHPSPWQYVTPQPVPCEWERERRARERLRLRIERQNALRNATTAELRAELARREQS